MQPRRYAGASTATRGTPISYKVWFAGVAIAAAAGVFVGLHEGPPPSIAGPMNVKTDFSRDSDPNVVYQIVSTVNDLADEYPELKGVTVDSDRLPDGIYAQAGGGEITFSTNYTEHRTKFELAVVMDVARGYHPRLGKCTAASYVANHEAAHIIDQTRGGSVSRELASLTWTNAVDYGDLSRYSFDAENETSLATGEALAEAFAAVQCNGGNASERNIAALFD